MLSRLDAFRWLAKCTCRFMCDVLTALGRLVYGRPPGLPYAPCHCRIDSVDVAGKRVFIRVDFNVPQDKKAPLEFFTYTILPALFYTDLVARRLVMVHINASLQDPSVITNTQRIDAALPTIKYCLDKAPRVFGSGGRAKPRCVCGRQKARESERERERVRRAGFELTGLQICGALLPPGSTGWQRRGEVLLAFGVTEAEVRLSVDDPTHDWDPGTRWLLSQNASKRSWESQ